MALRIYKIARTYEWAETERQGVFSGSADDKRDGFLHFSAVHQLRGTIAKHFTREDLLLLVVVDAGAIEPALKWEVSRGGEKFPHLYGVLPLSAVLEVTEIRRGHDGTFNFPPEIP